jgi:hypothetical protein
MAYVAPARGEVNFAFDGAAYVAPARGEVTLSFAELAPAGPLEVAGFQGTNFGEPTAPGFYQAKPTYSRNLVTGEESDSAVILREDFSAPGSILNRKVNGDFGDITWLSETLPGYSYAISDGYLSMGGLETDLAVFWTTQFSQPSDTVVANLRVRGSPTTADVNRQLRC